VGTKRSKEGRKEEEKVKEQRICGVVLNPLNAELNPIFYLLALLRAHHFLHVSRIRVKSLTLRLLMSYIYVFNPLNAELNPIFYLLALLGAHHFLHVSRIRVKSLTLRLLMSCIYIWSIYS